MRSCGTGVVVAVTALLVQASGVSAQATRASIVGARVDGPSRGVYFEAPFEVDWQKVCRTRLPWAFGPLTAKRIETIQRSYCEPCGSSGLFFRAPAPDADERPRAYFIGVGAVYRLDTFEPSGEARFAMRSSGDEPRFEQCVGQAVSTPDGAVGELVGGFVVLTRDARATHLQSDAALELEAVGDEMTIRLRTADGDRETTISRAGRTSVLHSDLVAVGNERFLFIQWAPDEACAELCCRKRFSLFTIGDELELAPVKTTLAIFRRRGGERGDPD